MTKDERRGDISNRLTDHIEATNTQSRMRRELWSSHTVTVDFIEAEIEAAVAAERERIIEELEKWQKYYYGTDADVGILSAIEIVKGGEK